jgi:His/Glu/Gln/Arg/opine family amino acid ABC transporter permease subunit
MYFDLPFMIRSFPKILSGLPNTLLITAVSMLVGLILGFFVALCRLHKIPVLSRICAVYVSFIRGTPLIVQLYLVFYTLPRLISLWNGDGKPVVLSPLVVALICFSLNTAAYLSRAIGGALASVSFSQLEAALSVGETYWQGLFRIVMPQALVIAFPTLTNSLLNLLKGTSLAFTVMVVDLMARAQIVGAEGFRYIESYLACVVIYWFLCFSISRLCRWWGGKLHGVV